MLRTNHFVIVSFLLIFLAAAHSAMAQPYHEERDLDADKALGGLIPGSVILSPGQYENGAPKPVPGSAISPSMDAGSTLSGRTGGISGAPNLGASFGTSPAGGIPGDTVDQGITADVVTDLGGEETIIGSDISGGHLLDVEISSGILDVDIQVDQPTEDTSLVETLTEEIEIGAEIDASGEASGSETDIGIEADVDGSVSGDDIGSDPADGLSSDPLL